MTAELGRWIGGHLDGFSERVLLMLCFSMAVVESWLFVVSVSSLVVGRRWCVSDECAKQSKLG